MKQTISVLFVVITLISSNVIYSQESSSIQINGGIISPISSSNGLTALIQYNYNLTPIVSFYIYSGYSYWDKFNVIYQVDLSPVQRQKNFKTYASDEHILVPLYLGSRINLHTNNIFTLFTNIEIGYSYLKYNSFNHWESVDPETGEILGYYPDPTSKKEIQENVFGIGVGVGLSHPITDSINLLFSVKLNSNINSEYSELFSSRQTYTMFLAGFNFNI